jgi:hypothetical protein
VQSGYARTKHSTSWLDRYCLAAPVADQISRLSITCVACVHVATVPSRRQDQSVLGLTYCSGLSLPICWLWQCLCQPPAGSRTTRTQAPHDHRNAGVRHRVGRLCGSRPHAIHRLWGRDAYGRSDHGIRSCRRRGLDAQRHCRSVGPCPKPAERALPRRGDVTVSSRAKPRRRSFRPTRTPQQ